MGDLTPITPAHAQGDREAALALAVAAFDEDPFYRWLFPRRRVGKVRAIMRYVLRKSRVHVVDGGFIAWTEPVRSPLRAPVRTALADVAMAARVLSAIGAWRRLSVALGIYRELARARPPTPHVELQLIAVGHSHRGRGLARTLLEGLLAKADRHGWPIVLETTNPQNPPFYERFGFVTTLVVQRGDAPAAWVMTRASPARTR